LLTEHFADSVPAHVLRARLALASDDAQMQREALQALVAEDGPLAWAAGDAWRCSSCGTRTSAYGWRCDHCRRWATLYAAVAQEPAPAAPVIVAPRDRRTLARPAATLSELGLPAPTVDGLPAILQARPSVLRRASGWLNRRSRRAQAEKKRASRD